MALGNLSIRVNAEIGGFTSGMDQASKIAKERMGQSSDAVSDFRTSLLQTSAAMQQMAVSMGANMEAANDAIKKGAAESAVALKSIQGAASSSLEGMAKDADTKTRTLAENVKEHIKSGFEVAFDYAKKAVETAFAVRAIQVFAAELVGVATGLLEIYAIYRGLKALGNFAVGLVTGESYKSQDIDAVIAYNKQVTDLQESLHLSSIEAGALNDALGRLGVDKGDYKTVFEGVDRAIHSNEEELTRLGVKFKDVNGGFLQNREVLENVKKALDEYTEGYSRNAAAAAMGMGSYKQITEALKVNNEEIKNSKTRLDEYQLGMSQYGQETVSKYQQAMREFENENQLFSRGIKQVISDAIMPAFTTLANFFKDGWPSIVQAFRVGVSAIVAIGYIMADGIYAAAKSVTTGLGIISDAVNGVDKAAKALLSGDLQGAGKALIGVWDSAKDRIKAAGNAIADVVADNNKKIRLATANDGRDAAMKLTQNGTPAGTKTFHPPAPKVASLASNDDPAKKFLEGQLREQEAFVASEKTLLQTREQFLQGTYQQEYITASEYYGRKKQLIADNLAGQIAAYDKEIQAIDKYLASDASEVNKQDMRNKRADLERKKTEATISTNKELGLVVQENAKIYRDFELSTTEWLRQQDLGNKEMQFSIDMMGKSSLEVAKLTAARRIDLDVQEQIRQMMKKDPSADVSSLVNAGEAAKARAMATIQSGDDKAKDPWFNMKESVRQYGEQASNTGQQIGQAMQNAFRGAEDALVNFAMTGKLSFKGLAQSILADLARIQAKNLIASLTGGSSGGAASGIAGMLAGLFGGGAGYQGAAGVGGTGSVADFMQMDIAGARAMGGPVAGGSNYLVGEKGAEIFSPSTSGTIIPNNALGGGVTINVTNIAPNAQAQVRPSADGNTFEVLVSAIKNSIGEDIAYGTGSVNGALQSRYGLRAAV